MRINNNLERFWIVLKTNSGVSKVVKDFETLEDSNSMGFKSTYSDCMNYITMNKGTNHSYFEDYKGGSVCVVDVETGNDVYREDI